MVVILIHVFAFFLYFMVKVAFENEKENALKEISELRTQELKKITEQRAFLERHRAFLESDYRKRLVMDFCPSNLRMDIYFRVPPNMYFVQCTVSVSIIIVVFDLSVWKRVLI